MVRLARFELAFSSFVAKWVNPFPYSRTLEGAGRFELPFAA